MKLGASSRCTNSVFYLLGTWRLMMGNTKSSTFEWGLELEKPVMNALLFRPYNLDDPTMLHKRTYQDLRHRRNLAAVFETQT